MIFVTVGTHEPFDRLVQAVDDWCGTIEEPPEILAQVTERASYRPRHFPTVATLTPEDYDHHVSRAQAIVSHAGMGSLITAFSARKPILILPRRGHLHETRNDHQFATMQRFRKFAGVFAAEDETQLPQVMDRLHRAKNDLEATISPYADKALISALRNFIHED